MTANRTRPVCLILALLLGGCAQPRSGSLGPAPTVLPGAGHAATGRSPTPAPATSRPGPPPAVTTPGGAGPVASGTTPPATITVQLWFTRDGRLVPTRRGSPYTVATSRLSLAGLAAGPTPAEAAVGLTTTVPDGAVVVGIDDAVATVAVPPAFLAGPESAVRLRQAQVVYSLTQFPTVRRVAFAPPGERPGPALGRDDLADLLPPIVVTDPVIGARVTSPITVAGTANVFEATVTVRLLDAAGRQIATAFTTATCGTGCRGGYQLTLGYRVPADQPGTIEVYEVSAADGSRVHVVAVPVALTAAT